MKKSHSLSLKVSIIGLIIFVLLLVFKGPLNTIPVIKPFLPAIGVISVLIFLAPLIYLSAPREEKQKEAPKEAQQQA